MVKKRARRRRGTSELGTFGGRLQAVREAHKQTQVDLATLCDISRAAVSQWETNATEPGAKRLRVLADHYGLSYEWLAFGDGDVPAFLTGQGLPHVVVEPEVKIAEMGRNHHWQLPLPVVGSLLQSRNEGLIVWQSESEFRPLINRHDFVFLDQARQRIEPHGLWLIDLPNHGPTLLKSQSTMTKAHGPVVSLVSDDDRIDIRPKTHLRIIGKVVAFFRAV